MNLFIYCGLELALFIALYACIGQKMSFPRVLGIGLVVVLLQLLARSDYAR